MDNSILSLVISSVALAIAATAFYLAFTKKKSGKEQDEPFSTKPLQLQAYERLVVLAERMAIPNLISRANQGGLSAIQMRRLLLDSLKQEYEYNISQQVYVSPVAWQAINNLKDQNMLIINQVAQTLPEDASGLDLNKRILEVLMNQKKSALHTVVLEAINYEARKMMR